MVVDEKKGRELAVIEGEFRQVTSPRVTGDEALAAWRSYIDLQDKILVTDPKRDDSDVVLIEGKARKKKSAWRKLGTYFGISVAEISSKIGHRHDDRCGKVFAKKNGLEFDVDREDCGCPVVFAKFVVRASDPRTGRSFDGLGIASMRERSFGPKADHNLPALAWTRAANRAIADLIGGGEVSAEDPAGEIEKKEAEGLTAGDGLSELELAAYRKAWTDAPQERRDRARAELERAGYGPGEFQRRGKENLQLVMGVLEGKDEAP